jgi:hypothetical protein
MVSSVSVLNLPWNNALVVLQADRKWTNANCESSKQWFFFLVILFNYFFIEMTLNQLVIALIIIMVLPL